MSYNLKYTGEELESILDSVKDKEDKEEGKGLSSNDFTDEDKEKLDGLENYDDSELSRKLTELSAEVGKKQNTITDLENIRSGAEKGATALQSVPDTYATKDYVDQKVGQGGGGSGQGGSTTDLTAVAKWGVKSHTLTREGGIETGFRNVVSNPQYGWIPQQFIDQVYEEFGVSFNADKGYFEYDDITNLSYEEALESATILPNFQKISSSSGSNTIAWYVYLKNAPNYGYSKLRALLVPRGLRESAAPRSYWVMRFEGGSPIHLESANLFAKYPAVQTWANFYYCLGLRKAGKYSFSGLSSIDSSAFSSCYSLEEVWINSLGINLSIAHSPLLKNECILYMIQNATKTGITITLHSSAYDRAMADSEIAAAMESKQVNLAKA